MYAQSLLFIPTFFYLSFLFPADRLWIQRPIPKPRPTKPKPQLKANLNVKVKAKLSTSKSKSLKRNGDAGPSHLPSSKSTSKRPRLQYAPSSSSKFQPTLDAVPGTGRGRAAKLHANLKLDAQAKELIKLNRQAAELARLQSSLRSSRRGQVSSITENNAIGGDSSGTRKERDRVIGTRISARLRGNARDSADGEWQAVPQEWLVVEGSNGRGKEEQEAWMRDAAVKTGLESEGSEISDLTELSEDAAEADDDEGEEEEHTQEGKKVMQVDDGGTEDPLTLPEGFIEWETVRHPRLNKPITHSHGFYRYASHFPNGSTSQNASPRRLIISRRRYTRSS